MGVRAAWFFASVCSHPTSYRNFCRFVLHEVLLADPEREDLEGPVDSCKGVFWFSSRSPTVTSQHVFFISGQHSCRPISTFEKGASFRKKGASCPKKRRRTKNQRNLGQAKRKAKAEPLRWMAVVALFTLSLGTSEKKNERFPYLRQILFGVLVGRQCIFGVRVTSKNSASCCICIFWNVLMDCGPLIYYQVLLLQKITMQQLPTFRARTLWNMRRLRGRARKYVFLRCRVYGGRVSLSSTICAWTGILFGFLYG